MNENQLDLRLLTVFQALMDKRQVSAASEFLGLSQPTVSRSLGKLRKYFGDPLFVRTQYGMEPTPFAVDLSSAVDEIVQLYETKLLRKPVFEPETSRRSFRIAGSDVGHVLLFSHLLPLVSVRAPNVQLHAIPLGPSSLVGDLESGACDVAFGPYPKLYAGIHERTLYHEQYVCLARRDHPRIDSTLSASEFKKADHILITAQGLGHGHEWVESQITRSFSETGLRVVAQSFLVGALLAEKSDSIVTVPSGVAQALGYFDRLRAFRPPVDLPSFDVKLYWHERYHRDPAHKWLRELIYERFSGIENILEQELH